MCLHIHSGTKDILHYQKEPLVIIFQVLHHGDAAFMIYYMDKTLKFRFRDYDFIVHDSLQIMCFYCESKLNDPKETRHFNLDYSTGVQIVSCTLSDDSVLSESTGLCNPVLCVSQWNLFWQKNQPIRLCLSNQVRPGREWFLSPLGDFNRLFEGLIGELFKIWHWNMFYFFKWHQSGP